MSAASCCLCAQIAGDPRQDLLHARFGGPYERRVRDVAGGVSLLPSLGALVPGHVLLCPRQHVRSFAQLDRRILRRVQTVAESIADELGVAASGRVQIFEHGDARDADRVSCSVEHAHLHLIPGVADIWPAARAVGRWRTLPSLDAVHDAVGDGEYLALRAAAGLWRVAVAPPGGYPSQLLRQLVADSVGRPEMWNWRTHPALERTASSWRMIRELSAS